jgi:hypothetical protein
VLLSNAFGNNYCQSLIIIIANACGGHLAGRQPGSFLAAALQQVTARLVDDNTNCITIKTEPGDMGATATQEDTASAPTRI